MLQSRASRARSPPLQRPARRSPSGGGPSREPAHRVPAAAAGAASSPSYPWPRLASSSRSPSPGRPAVSKAAPFTPAPSPGSQSAEERKACSPRRFRGWTRTATFTLVSGHVGGARWPQAALHARAPSAAAAPP